MELNKETIIKIYHPGLNKYWKGSGLTKHDKQFYSKTYKCFNSMYENICFNEKGKIWNNLGTALAAIKVQFNLQINNDILRDLLLESEIVEMKSGDEKITLSIADIRKKF